MPWSQGLWRWNSRQSWHPLYFVKNACWKELRVREISPQLPIRSSNVATVTTVVKRKTLRESRYVTSMFCADTWVENDSDASCRCSDTRRSLLVTAFCSTSKRFESRLPMWTNDFKSRHQLPKRLRCWSYSRAGRASDIR